MNISIAQIVAVTKSTTTAAEGSQEFENRMAELFGSDAVTEYRQANAPAAKPAEEKKAGSGWKTAGKVALGVASVTAFGAGGLLAYNYITGKSEDNGNSTGNAAAAVGFIRGLLK